MAEECPGIYGTPSLQQISQKEYTFPWEFAAFRPNESYATNLNSLTAPNPEPRESNVPSNEELRGSLQTSVITSIPAPSQVILDSSYISKKVSTAKNSFQNVSYMIPVYFGQPEFIVSESPHYHRNSDVTSADGAVGPTNVECGMKPKSYLEYLEEGLSSGKIEEHFSCTLNPFDYRNRSNHSGNCAGVAQFLQESVAKSPEPANEVPYLSSSLNGTAQQGSLSVLEDTNCEQSISLETVIEKENTPTDTEKDVPYFECFVCHQRFTRKDNLQRHTRTAHSKIDSYACDNCGTTIKRFDNFLNHKVTCTKSNDSEQSKTHNCPECSKTFFRKQDLTRHMANIHTALGEKKYFNCNDCGYKTLYSNLLKRHKAKEHTSTNCFGLHRCIKCNVEFKTSYRLNKHRVHGCTSSQKTCKICFKDFKSKVALKEHFSNIHSDHLLDSIYESAVYETFGYMPTDLNSCTSSSLNGISTETVTPLELQPSVILNLLARHTDS